VSYDIKNVPSNRKLDLTNVPVKRLEFTRYTEGSSRLERDSAKVVHYAPLNSGSFNVQEVTPN